VEPSFANMTIAVTAEVQTATQMFTQLLGVAASSETKAVKQFTFSDKQFN
jgi:hypothetical protein